MQLNRNVLALIIFMALAIFGGFLAQAAEENPSIKFEWNQDPETYAVLTRWQFGYGETAGGPYGQFFDVAKSNPTAPDTYQADATVTYTGTPGQVVTKYFIVRACISASDSECSAWSNEVSHAVTIPIGPPTDLKKVSATVAIKIEAIIRDTISAIEEDGQPAGG